MEKKIGKKRDPKDQFYTNPGISEYCIEVFQNTVDIDCNDILLEPCPVNLSTEAL